MIIRANYSDGRTSLSIDYFNFQADLGIRAIEMLLWRNATLRMVQQNTLLDHHLVMIFIG